MHKVAIIGPIGSGKSEVLRICVENDFPSVSADHIARMLLELPGVAHDDVLDEFPTAVLANGRIDRHKLAKLVFSNYERLRKLESLVHPHVWQIVTSFFMECENKKEDICFVEVSAPDGAIGTRFDEMWLVDTPREVRMQRCIAKGMTEQDFIARDSLQQEHTDFHSLSTRVIENAGATEDLEKTICCFLDELSEIRER